MIARGAHLSAARAHEGPCLLSRKPQVKKRKTRLRAWFGFPLTFALFARDRPATPPARPRKFSKKYRVPRGPRALLSETATPAILRTFRTSSVTLNQSHPIFRVFFVFTADFSDQRTFNRVGWMCVCDSRSRGDTGRAFSHTFARVFRHETSTKTVNTGGEAKT